MSAAIAEFTIIACEGGGFLVCHPRRHRGSAVQVPDQAALTRYVLNTIAEDRGCDAARPARTLYAVPTTKEPRHG